MPSLGKSRCALRQALRGRTFAAVALLAWSWTASGADGDAIRIAVSQDVLRDANLFRVADGERPVIDGVRRPRGDTLSVTNVAAIFDHTYSRQRLGAELALSRNDYLEFDHLDFTARNLAANWQWVLGNQWSGTIGGEQSERLRSFSDRGSTVRSINTFRRYRADARLLLHPQWSVGAGWARIDSRFDDALSASAAYIEDAVEALGQYRSPAGSTLALVARTADGRYPERAESLTAVTRYVQRDLLLRADWTVTGHSRLNGQAGYTWREYPRLGEKNFNGFTGRLTYDWAPTGKFGVGVTARREMGAREDVADNFVVTRAVSLDPLWRATDKLRVRGRLEWLRRDYGGDPFSRAAPERDDRTRNASVTLEWQAQRDVTLQIGGRTERRSDSDAAPGYRSNLVFAGAKIAF